MFMIGARRIVVGWPAGWGGLLVTTGCGAAAASTLPAPQFVEGMRRGAGHNGGANDKAPGLGLGPTAEGFVLILADILPGNLPAASDRVPALPARPTGNAQPRP